MKTYLQVNLSIVVLNRYSFMLYIIMKTICFKKKKSQQTSNTFFFSFSWRVQHPAELLNHEKKNPIVKIIFVTPRRIIPHNHVFFWNFFATDSSAFHNLNFIPNCLDEKSVVIDICSLNPIVPKNHIIIKYAPPFFFLKDLLP